MTVGSVRQKYQFALTCACLRDVGCAQDHFWCKPQLTNALSMQENISRLQQAALAGTPLLLEGDTGIGKSATIQAAAAQSGAGLVRFNMSSHITVDDLFGRVALETQDGIEGFVFVRQPFTVAFESGSWLLLDELNLAPDNVLQSIEAAIDSGELHLTDSSSSTNHDKRIKMHPSFRLFAAQNPATNEFRGKRETLSSSLLDRFQPLQLLTLPESECAEIIANHLDSGSPNGLASSYAKRMVAMHAAVASCLSKKIGSSAQPSVLATFTLRELLKWAARCSLYFRQETCLLPLLEIGLLMPSPESIWVCTLPLTAKQICVVFCLHAAPSIDLK